MNHTVFEIESDGETEWVVADDVLSALKFYLGLSGSDIDVVDKIREVKDSELDSLFVTQSDEPDNPKISFREALKGFTYTPDMLASTAYE